jgi:uncharacterized protein
MDSGVMSEAMVDTAFAALPQLRETGPPDKVDLVVFGGEPLMDEPEQQTRVQGILNRGRAMGFSTKILSNGISLEEAVPWLAGRVDVVQVTIDGPQNIHAARRRLPHGDSFAPMVTGVTTAVAAGMRINLRINVDECNVDRLPEVADTIDAQGWMDSGLVRAILAPVKNHNPKRAAIDESVLLARVLQLVHSDWRMGIYELEGFSGIKYFNGFRDTGLLSLHRFFSCEAQINFYALDVHGDVYACWDAAGIRNLAVGHFHPELHIDEAKLQHWRARSSLAFEPCGTCPSSPHCGGGCQFLAYEHSQRFEAPSCDSMLDGFAQAVHDNASWLLERARTGDHAVGLVTSDGVVQPVTHPFGLLEQGTEAPLLIDC